MHAGHRGVLGEEQAGRLQRLPYPACSIQPRRDREGDGLEVDCARRDTGSLQQRSDPWARCMA